MAEELEWFIENDRESPQAVLALTNNDVGQKTFDKLYLHRKFLPSIRVFNFKYVRTLKSF